MPAVFRAAAPSITFPFTSAFHSPIITAPTWLANRMSASPTVPSDGIKGVTPLFSMSR